MLLLTAMLLSSSVQQLQKRVEEFDPRSDIRSLERIARYGCQAVPYLVENLKPVSARTAKLPKSSSNETMKTVWTIAALRYVTGQYFRSKYVTSSSDVGRQSLKSGGSGGKFFEVWTSRDIVYFNGISEQRKIILQWKRYLRDRVCKDGSVNKYVVFWMNGVHS